MANYTPDQLITIIQNAQKSGDSAVAQQAAERLGQAHFIQATAAMQPGGHFTPGQPVDMGPQGAPPGLGERLLGTGAADARALMALPNAAVLQPAGAALARLGVNASNDVLGTHFNPAAAGATAERALAAPPPMTPEEAAIRGAPGRLAGDVAGLLPAAARAAIDRTPQPIQDATTLLAPAAAGEASLPARGAEQTVARAPADVAQAAGYTGLNTGADLKSSGAQAITDRLLADDAGVVKGAVPNVKAVQNARKVGPGKVYDDVKAAIPEKLSQDDQLKTDLGAIDSSGGSQLPSPQDVAGLKETLLGQPDMTRDQLFANISKARERAADAYASEGDVDKTALGDAYSQVANAYENFADRQLPNGSDLKGAIPGARAQFAKSYLAEKSLQGGEHFNPMVYARAARNNPDLLTGNAGIVADVANNLPASKPNTVANALGSGLGAVGGYVAGRALGEPLGAAGLGGVAGWHLPAVVGGVRRALATGGNPELAAATGGNPALSYYFGDRGSPFAPAIELTPAPGAVGIAPQQGGLPLGPRPTPEILPEPPPVQGNLALRPGTFPLERAPGAVGAQPTKIPGFLHAAPAPSGEFYGMNQMPLTTPPGSVGVSPNYAQLLRQQLAEQGIESEGY